MQSSQFGHFGYSWVAIDFNPTNGQVSWSGNHDAILLITYRMEILRARFFIIEVYDTVDQRLRDQVGTSGYFQCSG